MEHLEHDFFIPAALEDEVDDLWFELYNPKTDEIEHHTLSNFHGKRLILFFYPADFTFVCPTELKDLNKVYGDIADNNAEVLVVSTDSVFSHKRRAETEPLLKGFEIKMVSDRRGDLSEHLGVRNLETGNADRGTFIISPEGVIKSIEIVTEPIGRSSNELVRKLKALEFVANNPGQACPASRNWPKDQTLKPGIKIAGNVWNELK